MKTKIKYVLGFLFAWGFGAEVAAYFPDQENFVRTEFKVDIEILDLEHIQVKLHQRIKNTSEVSQPLNFAYPLPGHARDLNVFIDARGETFEVLSGNQRLERLFDLAKESEDATYFRMAQSPYEKLVQMPEIGVLPDQTVHYKLVYKQKLDFVNDFYFSEIFIDDDLTSDVFDLTFSLVSDLPIWHFFTNLPSGGHLDRAQRQQILLYEKTFFKPSENLRFFWSLIENPTLVYSSKGEVYHGHFVPRPLQKSVDEVVFLVDASGSMSGNPWIRTQEYMNFLLEEIADKKRVRIAFFDDQFRWYNADWRTNDHIFRKGFIEQIKTMRPLGKGDITDALNQANTAWESSEDRRLMILITDEDLPLDFIPESEKAPVITLTFAANPKNPLEVLSFESGGFFQRLFRTPPKLIEASEIIDKWKRWSNSVTVENIVTKEGETDLLPKVLPGGAYPASPLFVGRTFDLYSPGFAPAAQFLPRVWGARRLVEILQKPDYSDEDLDAMLSIAHRFGIQTSFLKPDITRVQLGDALQILDPGMKRWEIMQLKNAQNFFPNWGGKFLGEIPLYYSDTDQLWRSYDFLERANRQTLLEIAPFSEAQKQLLLRFPKMLAAGFGASNQSEFCVTFRCVAVRDGSRQEPALEDRLFFKDFDPLHWANAYMAQLIDEGVFTPAANGKLHPNREIDRGTFVQMIYDYLKVDRDYIGLQQFLDIGEEDALYSKVHWFYDEGIIKGYSDGTFRPFQSLSRAEAVKIILAVKGMVVKSPHPGLLPGGEGDTEVLFPDSTGWERPWVLEAHKIGLVQGYADGTFRPHEYLTRAQAAKLIIESGIR